MQSPGTHYLLFAEALVAEDGTASWRFVLHQLSTGERLVACDDQGGEAHERAELLAVVRGLEALDGPSQVTLITGSRYVSNGVLHGLDAWRESGFRWERFGRVVPVRDEDLWRRVDRALSFHDVDCRPWRFDSDTSTREKESCVGDGADPSRRHENPLQPMDELAETRPRSNSQARRRVAAAAQLQSCA